MSKYKDPRLKRLEMEHQLLQELAKHSDLISFQPLNQRPGFPPEAYRVYYNVRSIIGIDNRQLPIYADNHTVEITFPAGYPMTAPPVCYMKTPAWHPNIRSSGESQGHICINAQVLGSWYTLDMLVEQIGEMLQFKNYHAEHVLPYPEDAMVAKWIREFAEKNDIVNKRKKIFTDKRPLLKASEEWLNSRKEKIQITILNVKKQPDGDPSNPPPPEPPPPPQDSPGKQPRFVIKI